MEMNDIVKLNIYSSDLGRMISYVVSRVSAINFNNAYTSNIDNYLRVQGNLNDVDGNACNVILLRESVGAIEVIEVNSNF